MPHDPANASTPRVAADPGTTAAAELRDIAAELCDIAARRLRLLATTPAEGPTNAPR
jgi:hypothetical protein